MKNIILREQASQTGLSVAEVAAHNEATPPSSRESFTSAMSSMSPPPHYRMDTPPHHRMDAPFQARNNTPSHLQHDEAMRE